MTSSSSAATPRCVAMSTIEGDEVYRTQNNERPTPTYTFLNPEAHG